MRNENLVNKFIQRFISYENEFQKYNNDKCLKGHKLNFVCESITGNEAEFIC